MSSRLLSFSEQIYLCLLQAYPATFRKRFAAEMAQVFRALCIETYRQSGVGGVLVLWISSGWDWLWAAMIQWWLHLFKQRMGNMQTNLVDRRDGIEPLSAIQAGIAALPFLAFGIACLASKLGLFQNSLASLPLWQILFINPFLIFNWLNLIGLGVGILAGFPRWTYSFLGWTILFAWSWMGMRFYGYSVGWKIWLPPLGVFLITLLIRRSWQPLRTLLAGMWRDWTMPSLGFYIFYGSVYMVYDENHHPYLLAFIAFSTIAISLGAWGYFRSISPLRRVLALIGGLLAATVLSGVSYATWDYRAYYGLPDSVENANLVGLIFFTSLALLMIGNGLLARWRLLRDTRLKKI